MFIQNILRAGFLRFIEKSGLLKFAFGKYYRLSRLVNESHIVVFEKFTKSLEFCKAAWNAGKMQIVSTQYG